MSSNENLKDFIDLSSNSEAIHLIKSKIATKARMDSLEGEQKQIDKQLKELIGDHLNWQVGEVVGTYRYEYRAEHVRKESNPRILRIS
jgi:hypothetical protein